MNRQQGQDPYRELGVPRTADAAEIKKAYRSLAQKFHPDRNEGDVESEEKFKRVSAAYAVLSDEKRKQQYDEFGEIALDPNFDAENYRRATGGFHGGGFREGFQGSPFSGNFNEGQGFGNIFEDLFGGRAQGPRPQRGADLETSLELDFAEAALGAEKRVDLDRPQPGGGSQRETLKVRIPAGADDGSRIRLSGKGAPGSHGGPNGDLFARLRVRPHAFLKRSDRDLSMDLPISVMEAIEGAKIDIPTLEGTVSLRVPPGSSGGTRLRLRGKGVAASKSKKEGDLYVTLRIKVPKEVDPEKLTQLKEILDDDPETWRKEAFSS